MLLPSVQASTFEPVRLLLLRRYCIADVLLQPDLHTGEPARDEQLVRLLSRWQAPVHANQHEPDLHRSADGDRARGRWNDGNRARAAKARRIQFDHPDFEVDLEWNALMPMKDAIEPTKGGDDDVCAQEIATNHMEGTGTVRG